MPRLPAQLNPKINAVASEVIMKALAKDPAQRYQSGREMANDLEKCRENSGQGGQEAPNPRKVLCRPTRPKRPLPRSLPHRRRTPSCPATARSEI